MIGTTGSTSADQVMAPSMIGSNVGRRSSAARPVRHSRAGFLPGFLRTGVGLGLLASVIASIVVLFGLGGWQYYWTPEDVRAYTDLHRLLRPSGPVGNLLGITGVFLMLIMHLYTIRKRLPQVQWLGRVTLWLEFHIFCGIFGPALITLHTSFKFNGLISVAYWSMVIVVLSGFVGRYLYIRIPRSIRGQELTLDELAARTAVLRTSMQASELPQSIQDRIEAFDRQTTQIRAEDTTWFGLFFGEIGLRFAVLRLGSATRHQGADRTSLREAVSLTSQRAFLVRRIAYLTKTRKIFDLWRVYHKPLAVLMALIVILHVATIWYLGYGLAIGWGGAGHR